QQHKVVVLKLFLPRLTYYDNYSKEGLFSVELVAPISKIVQVRTNRSIGLDIYPALRILQLKESTSLFLEIVEQLEESLDLCPYLETIEMVFGSFQRNDFGRHVIRQRLAAWNERAGRQVGVLFGERWERESPVDQYEWIYPISASGPRRRMSSMASNDARQPSRVVLHLPPGSYAEKAFIFICLNLPRAQFPSSIAPDHRPTIYVPYLQIQTLGLLSRNLHVL
ncbi:hypothetical protein M408DRAFT_31231, partial [Serendipita vermifera MAFF 305830]